MCTLYGAYSTSYCQMVMFFILCMISLSSCTDPTLTCFDHTGQFAGTASICKGTSFVVKHCVDPLAVTANPTIVSNVVSGLAALGGTEYTQAKCDAAAQNMNTQLLSSGCALMKGTLKIPLKCDVSQFCADAGQKVLLGSTCSTDADCPSQVTAPSEIFPCCQYVKSLLKQRCTKYDDAVAQFHVDELSKVSKCKPYTCVGASSTGSTTRMLRIFTFLVVLVTCFHVATS